MDPALTQAKTRLFNMVTEQTLGKKHRLNLFLFFPIIPNSIMANNTFYANGFFLTAREKRYG